MTTAAPEYYVRTTAYSSRCRTPSIIICSIHFGARQAERETERESDGVEACRAVWLCKCLCSTWNVCELLLLLHKTVHIFECHMGEGAERRGRNCFLCALPAALKYFAYASSGLKRRLTMQGTKYVAILALCTILISPPPCHFPSLYTLPAHTVPICRQVCFATQAWKTPSKSSVKFWPSNLLINAKEEGREGKGSGREREGKERRGRSGCAA